MESNSVTIFHNPQCATSRNTLGLIRNSGIEPTIVDYLRNPPTRDQLAEMIGAAGLSVRAALREKGTPFRELGLGDPALNDQQLLAAMVAHPVLIDRPFVATSRGTRLCRRPELVLEILPRTQRGFFAKENGEILVAADGKRVRSRLR
jgi:arsenate reductase (glutaredoxin)